MMTVLVGGAFCFPCRNEGGASLVLESVNYSRLSMTIRLTSSRMRVFAVKRSNS